MNFIWLVALTARRDGENERVSERAKRERELGRKLLRAQGAQEI